jgi:methyl-accepting chemotaxis protein
MTAEAQRLSSHPGRTHPPRKLRNYLLEPKFQLKYTGMVVGVTIVVAAVLGYQAYKYSTGQTELLNIEKMEAATVNGTDTNAQFIADLEGYAREADRKVALAVMGGIGVLALALGFTGIVVTHRLVGPAYRLKQLLKQVSAGSLHPAGSLRKHDELQEVFTAFQDMVTSLRSRREQELAALDDAIERAKASGSSDAALEPLRALRERLRAVLAAPERS